MWTFIFIVLGLFLVIGVIAAVAEAEADKKRTPAQRRQVQALRKEQALTASHGALNRALICPHCATKGQVRTKRIVAKKGISGGKATGAILTGGVSLLATGLSRKEAQTQARCDNCSSTWAF